mmetsp:Transcript_12775/g.19012  ORF Transcript_12775/g.19012 Transcript_12775/m.19012 type:complete len:81 (-) Transcript_12775:486-728(-)
MKNKILKSLPPIIFVTSPQLSGVSLELGNYTTHNELDASPQKTNGERTNSAIVPVKKETITTIHSPPLPLEKKRQINLLI